MKYVFRYPNGVVKNLDHFPDPSDEGSEYALGMWELKGVNSAGMEIYQLRVPLNKNGCVGEHGNAQRDRKDDPIIISSLENAGESRICSKYGGGRFEETESGCPVNSAIMFDKQKRAVGGSAEVDKGARSHLDDIEESASSPDIIPIKNAGRPSIKDKVDGRKWFVWSDNGIGRYNGPVLKWDRVDKTKLINAVRGTVDEDLYDKGGDGYAKALDLAEKEVLDFRSGAYDFKNKGVWNQLEDFIRRCVIETLPDSMKGDKVQIDSITKKLMDGIIHQRKEFDKEMAFQKKFAAYHNRQYMEVSANFLADRLSQLSKKDLEGLGAAERFTRSPGDILAIMKDTGYCNEKNLSGTELLMDYFKELGKKSGSVRAKFIEEARQGNLDTKPEAWVHRFLTAWGNLFGVYNKETSLSSAHMIRTTQFSATANGLLQRLNNYLQGPETTMKSIPLPQHIAKRRTLDLLKEHPEYFGPRGNIPLGKKGRPIILSPFDEEAQTSRTHSRYREKPKRESLKGGERFREAEEGLLDKFFTTGEGARAKAERLTGEDAARAERYFEIEDAVNGMGNMRQDRKSFERQYGRLERILDKHDKNIPDVMELPFAKPRKFSKTEFKAVEAADPSELIKYWSNYRGSLHQALREAAAAGRIPKDELDSIKNEIIGIESRPVEVLIKDPPSTERMDALIRNYVPDEGFEAAPATFITRDKVSAIMDGLKSLKSDGSRNPRTDKAVDAATKILPKVLRYLMDSIKEGNELTAEEAEALDADKADESAEYDEQDVPEELFEDYLSDDDSEDEYDDETVPTGDKLPKNPVPGTADGGDGFEIWELRGLEPKIKNLSKNSDETGPEGLMSEEIENARGADLRGLLERQFGDSYMKEAYDDDDFLRQRVNDRLNNTRSYGDWVKENSRRRKQSIDAILEALDLLNPQLASKINIKELTGNNLRENVNKVAEDLIMRYNTFSSGPHLGDGYYSDEGKNKESTERGMKLLISSIYDYATLKKELAMVRDGVEGKWPEEVKEAKQKALKKREEFKQKKKKEKEEQE